MEHVSYLSEEPQYLSQILKPSWDLLEDYIHITMAILSSVTMIACSLGNSDIICAPYGVGISEKSRSGAYAAEVCSPDNLGFLSSWLPVIMVIQTLSLIGWDKVSFRFSMVRRKLDRFNSFYNLVFKRTEEGKDDEEEQPVEIYNRIIREGRRNENIIDKLLHGKPFVRINYKYKNLFGAILGFFMLFAHLFIYLVFTFVSENPCAFPEDDDLDGACLCNVKTAPNVSTPFQCMKTGIMSFYEAIYGVNIFLLILIILVNLKSFCWCRSKCCRFRQKYNSYKWQQLQQKCPYKEDCNKRCGEDVFFLLDCFETSTQCKSTAEKMYKILSAHVEEDLLVAPTSLQDQDV